ncbi:AAA family ATPase [Pseudomonas corrugata]|uniref:AAA family ATPase n=1 Tax=Pseudomonas corrugata TaxID=47879 RepID=A0A7Y6DJX3_9PSED|nr:AAA family ATPase [Pseudomonas corrugata]NUT90132.1 AAA family ATPase [Pseudomonas corrugata]
MSLVNLELENFKKFSNLSLDLSQPITLIYGENSSGKTSAIRALLSLMQTFSIQNKHHMLNAHGEYVDIGFYKDYIKDHNTKNRLGIAFTSDDFDTLHAKRTRSRKILTTHKLCYDYDADSSQSRLSSFTETVTHSKLSELIPKIHSSYGIEDFTDTVEAFKFSRLKTRSYFNYSVHPLAYLAIYQAWDRYSKNIDNIIQRRPKTVHLQQKFAIQATQQSSYDESENIGRHIFRRSMDQIDRLFSSLYYLGPLRMTPFRSYKISTQTSSVGINGENTPIALSRLHSMAQKDKSAKKLSKQKFENFTSWFEMIFPGRSVSAEPNEDVVRLKINNSERSDSIADVGFGFSQVLPILVQAAAMDPGETLIIEQPELHLHPRAQVAFANFLTAASRQGIKFIIETHSEHILKGLQLNISNTTSKAKGHKEDLNLSCDSLKIYYFHKDDSHDLMKLNQWGEIEGGWPSGFFDESYHISSKIVRNKIKGMSASRGQTKPRSPEDKK